MCPYEHFIKLKKSSFHIIITDGNTQYQFGIVNKLYILFAHI